MIISFKAFLDKQTKKNFVKKTKLYLLSIILYAPSYTDFCFYLIQP